MLVQLKPLKLTTTLVYKSDITIFETAVHLIVQPSKVELSLFFFF